MAGRPKCENQTEPLRMVPLERMFVPTPLFLERQFQHPHDASFFIDVVLATRQVGCLVHLSLARSCWVGLKMNVPWVCGVGICGRLSVSGVGRVIRGLPMRWWLSGWATGVAWWVSVCCWMG